MSPDFEFGARRCRPGVFDTKRRGHKPRRWRSADRPSGGPFGHGSRRGHDVAIDERRYLAPVDVSRHRHVPRQRLEPGHRFFTLDERPEPVALGVEAPAPEAVGELLVRAVPDLGLLLRHGTGKEPR